MYKANINGHFKILVLGHKCPFLVWPQTSGSQKGGHKRPGHKRPGHKRPGHKRPPTILYVHTWHKIQLRSILYQYD